LPTHRLWYAANYRNSSSLDMLGFSTAAWELAPGDKSGGSERRFYRALLRRADEPFDRHLARLAEG